MTLETYYERIRREREEEEYRMGFIRGNVFVCPDCKITFKYKTNLKIHKCNAKPETKSKRGKTR